MDCNEKMASIKTEDEKKVGQLKNDYKGMHDGHYEFVYVAFTPFKEKKGMMVIVR